MTTVDGYSAALPTSLELAEDVVSLTTTPLDTVVRPGCSHIIVDLGTDDAPSTFTNLRFAGQYTDGGDFYALSGVNPIPDEVRPRQLAYGSGYLPNGYWNFSHNGSNLSQANDGSRVFIFPAFGLKRCRAYIGFGTWTNVAIRQIVGQDPDLAIKNRVPKVTTYASASYTTTPYTSGDCIGGNVDIAAQTIPWVSWNAQNMAPRLTSFSFATYATVLTDFDLYFSEAGSNTQTDNSAFDMSYAEAILAVYEFRASPSGNQLSAIDLGASGGLGGVLQDINIEIPYVAQGVGISTAYADLYIVARQAVTFPGAADIWTRATIEL